MMFEGHLCHVCVKFNFNKDKKAGAVLNEVFRKCGTVEKEWHGNAHKFKRMFKATDGSRASGFREYYSGKRNRKGHWRSNGAAKKARTLERVSRQPGQGRITDYFK